MDDGATTDEPPRRRRWRGVSLATRLAAAVVVVSFIALVVATIVGLRAGLELGEELYENRLDALTSGAERDVSAALDSNARATEAIAASPATADAIEEFALGLDELASLDFDVDEATNTLIDAYEQSYFESLPTDAERASIADIVSESPAAVYLQSQYSITDDDVGGPAAIENAGDGTAWTETHLRTHASFRRMVEELGLLDLYLIDAPSARIVYSVEKQADVGTSLRSGPFSGSVLANTVLQVIEDPTIGSVPSDLGLYDATPGEVIGVLATPVNDGSRFVGVLAVTYDSERLTTLLNNDAQWADAGIPDSADVYLVGADDTLRSDPRGYVEDPTTFLDDVQATGRLSSTERDTVEALGTTVLTLRAVDSTVADDGDRTIREATSLDGVDVFADVTNLSVEGLGWIVVGEITQEEARSALGEFRDLLVVGTAVFVIVITFLAVAWAGSMMAPVRRISDRLAEDSTETGELVVPERSPIEFHHLASSFDEMRIRIEEQRVDLARARDERLGLLRKMLPASIAERVASGDIEQLDEVPSATVAVVVVHGLGELVREGGISNRALVDRLHEELDELGDAHGLDRIKVVGDTYFAACGHDRPYIDHAPRVVTFASDARDAIRSLGTDSATPMDVAIGIHTGAVTVGMAGGDRLVYDVWGDTVTIADHLARRAGRGEILMSDATHEMLPTELVCEPSERADGATAWSLPETATGGLR